MWRSCCSCLLTVVDECSTSRLLWKHLSNDSLLKAFRCFQTITTSITRSSSHPRPPAGCTVHCYLRLLVAKNKPGRIYLFKVTKKVSEPELTSAFQPLDQQSSITLSYLTYFANNVNYDYEFYLLYSKISSSMHERKSFLFFM